MNVLKRFFKAVKKTVFKPWLKIISMHLIVFYQKYLSRHTCMYEPTCSEYTLRCINNCGFFIGFFLGVWRILRCNPFTKGGFDPAPENYFKVRWVY